MRRERRGHRPDQRVVRPRAEAAVLQGELGQSQAHTRHDDARARRAGSAELLAAHAPPARARLRRPAARRSKAAPVGSRRAGAGGRTRRGVGHRLDLRDDHEEFDAYVLWPPPQLELPLKKHELIHQAIKLNERRWASRQRDGARPRGAGGGATGGAGEHGHRRDGRPPDFGWRGTPRAGGGLTGAALCRAAWGGMFDAVGGDDETLLVVVLGPQKDPLGDLPLPPNAVCAPNAPLVDILRAGSPPSPRTAGRILHGGAVAADAAPVCPTAGDQFDNAKPAARLGIGLWADRPDPDAGEAAAVGGVPRRGGSQAHAAGRRRGRRSCAPSRSRRRRSRRPAACEGRGGGARGRARAAAEDA